ncbi:MAG: hypothetical protein GY818_20265 [Planctomycetaceae bacterium]|nr:hypothetical protein [Planctomycetaceae bacterium]
MNECVNVSALRLKNLITVCLGAVTLFLGLPLSSLVANTIHVPRDWPTIQEAINAAGHGDVIEIAAGTYFPMYTLDTLGKKITLKGAVNSRTSRPATLIDGENLHDRGLRVFQCIGTENQETVFENLQIQNGWVDGSGGGMVCRNTNPTLRNCVFKSNQAYDTIGSLFGFQGYGGGLYCELRCPVLINCHFESNSALRSGGGAYCRQIDFMVFDDPENLHTVPFRGCSFSDNSTDGEDRPSEGMTTGQREGGGGLCFSRCYYSSNSEPQSILEDCVFNGNESPVGGGLLLDESLGTAEPLLTRCKFLGNSSEFELPRSGNGGGGIAMFKSRPTIRDCVFDGNEVVFNGKADGNGIGGGGALRTWFSSTTTSQEVTVIEGCTFTNNRVTGGASGGAYYLDDGNDQDVPQISDCQFNGNSAVGGRGGALFTVAGVDATFTQCNFDNNSADSGGGIYNSESFPTFVSCTLVGNWAVEAGGGIFNSNSDPTLDSCTLTENLAGNNGGGIYNDQESSSVLDNCVVTHNSAVNGNGGGIYTEQPAGGPTLRNTHVCGNSPDQIFGNWRDEGGNTVYQASPDLNGDGLVNGEDLGLLLVDWGEEGDCLAADLNGDQVVNGADFGLLLAAWGDYP